MNRRLIFLLCLIASFAVVVGHSYLADAQYGKPEGKKTRKEKPVKPEACYQCHDNIKELHAGGKHANVNCVYCHSGLTKHLQSPGPDSRPFTDVSWEACGNCHKAQYDSFMKEAYHRSGRDEKSQLTGRQSRGLSATP